MPLIIVRVCIFLFTLFKYDVPEFVKETAGQAQTNEISCRVRKTERLPPTTNRTKWQQDEAKTSLVRTEPAVGEK